MHGQRHRGTVPQKFEVGGRPVSVLPKLGAKSPLRPPKLGAKSPPMTRCTFSTHFLSENGVDFTPE